MEPFDPAARGTEEESWARVLRFGARWQPRTRGLLVVSPHPDDETLGAGGLIRAWVNRGGRVTLLSVTDGEAAYPDWSGLDRVRRGELRAALRVLAGGRVHLTRLGLPDGRVAAYRRHLLRSIVALLSADTTLIAPYEHDGHPDHDAAGAVCVEVAQSLRVPLARYPVWSWHLAAAGRLGGGAWGIFPLTRAERAAKARAASRHVSQLRPGPQPPIVPAQVMRHFQRPYEAFVLRRQ